MEEIQTIKEIWIRESLSIHNSICIIVYYYIIKYTMVTSPSQDTDLEAGAELN